MVLFPFLNDLLHGAFSLLGDMLYAIRDSLSCLFPSPLLHGTWIGAFLMVGGILFLLFILLVFFAIFLRKR